MKFVRTLNQVQYTENSVYGNRACDLAKLLSERVPVPSTFVLTTHAWDTFLRINNIQYKIDFILQQVDVKNERTLVNAYNSIRKLLIAHPLPPEVLSELKDAYESLGTKGALDEMMKEDRAPAIAMIASPDHVAEAESFEGIIQNVRTIEEVILALKEIYAMAYTPDSIVYRKNIGAKSFKTAVLFQAMPKAVASATGYSTDPEKQDLVFVYAYKGYTDLRDLVAKDFFHVKKEFLNIVASQIVEQTKIIRLGEDNHLTPEEFTDRGQSLNDKEVMEVARIAKKAEKSLDNPVKVFFSITPREFYVLFANRYAITNRQNTTKELEEKEVVVEGIAAGETLGVAFEKYEEETSETQAHNESEESVKEETNNENEISEDEDSQETIFDEELEDDTNEDQEDANDEDLDEEDTDDEDAESDEEDSSEEDLEEENENETDEDANEDDDDYQEIEYVEEEGTNEVQEDVDEEYVEDDDEDNESDEEIDDESDEDESSDEESDDDSDENAEGDEDLDDEDFDEESDDEDTDDEDTESDDEDSSEEDLEEENDDENETEDDMNDESDEDEAESDDDVENDDEEYELLEETSEDEKEMLNDSFRIIYAELAKEYEKCGEQAPDTITELIQKGMQKNLFEIDGLQNILAIKKKVRSGDDISEEEKNLVLRIVNALVK